jgi:hypothetical protein
MALKEVASVYTISANAVEAAMAERRRLARYMFVPRCEVISNNV